MNEPKYAISITWSDEDRGFVANCLELPTVSAFGLSAAEALAEVQHAIEAALETAQEEGWALPEPRGLNDFSGQFRLRIPPFLHRQLVALAQSEGVSLNHLCSTLLAAGASSVVAHANPDAAFGLEAP